RGSWLSAAALFAYAIAFSLAYVELPTDTGALILFGAVQVTMIGAGLRAGERLRPRQWAGVALALGGLSVLFARGLGAPPLGAGLAMAVAGVAWGCYSLRGRGTADPTAVTAANFVRSLPFVAAVALLAHGSLAVSADGAFHAILSGGVTSGLGYAAWYAAVPHLRAPR